MGKNKKVSEGEELRTGTDYDEYTMSIIEWVFYAVAAGAVLFGIGYVFYQHIILSGLLALGGLLYPKMRRKQIIAKRKSKLNLQFKDMLYSLSSAVGAGNSMEKALSVTLEDMRSIIASRLQVLRFPERSKTSMKGPFPVAPRLKASASVRAWFR